MVLIDRTNLRDLFYRTKFQNYKERFRPNWQVYFIINNVSILMGH